MACSALRLLEIQAGVVATSSSRLAMVAPGGKGKRGSIVTLRGYLGRKKNPAGAGVLFSR
jgi:hypothetical protein